MVDLVRALAMRNPLWLTELRKNTFDLVLINIVTRFIQWISFHLLIAIKSAGTSLSSCSFGIASASEAK